MNDSFRQKLQDYYDGKLSEEQRAEVEQELDNLEQYQQYIDEQLDRDQPHTNDHLNQTKHYTNDQQPNEHSQHTDTDEPLNQAHFEQHEDTEELLNEEKYRNIEKQPKSQTRHSPTTDTSAQPSPENKALKPAFMRRYGQLYMDDRIDQKKIRRIMRRSKWRSRSGTAGIVIGAFFAFIFVCTIFNIFFYGIQEGGRIDTYRDVIRSAIAVTQPNVSLESAGANVDTTGLHIKGAMEKQIGSSRVKIADYTVDISFNFARTYHTDWFVEVTPPPLPFQPPGADVSNDSAAAWKRLEHLPEGTVVEAYISFDQYYSTDQALQLFKDKKMKPLWLAVRPGSEADMNEPGSIWNYMIGFPYDPIWHDSDRTLLHQSEEKIGWFSSTSSSSYSYPNVQAYGSGDIRNKNFLNTLRLIQPYKGILRAPAPFYDFDGIIHYIEQNGVQIYGMAVTGPTKEVLKLKKEPFASRIQIGEVRLWNWEE
ncbi:anti-sigma factor [Paenibacillus shenyangensis]|uniref:anti-sigma factor n=1 Tax=Paenibacillus sp. A9 TaxID=1284352 RepID=UPI00037287EA|nr:anti-sigma factor [Paenibacillus sp. A9]